MLTLSVYQNLWVYCPSVDLDSQIVQPGRSEPSLSKYAALSSGEEKQRYIWSSIYC